jgi:hypothetical protein
MESGNNAHPTPLTDYWILSFANGHQDLSYVDDADSQRVTWEVERDLRDVWIPVSDVAQARSETRRFAEYLDWIVAHPAGRKNADDGDVLLEMAARDVSAADARKIVRWKRNVRTEWRELLSEFRTRTWAQKSPSDATIDAAVLEQRKEARRRAGLYRSALEWLAYEAPAGWRAAGAEVKELRRLARAAKNAQAGRDPLAFDRALERLIVAFRKGFAAWSLLPR